ncbi:aminoglycoside phosphotransferase family protein [Porticoccus sp. GXU_MW_L64]
MSPQPDTKALQNWLLDYLPASAWLQGELTLSPLGGDAGFRRYFRLNTQPSLLAVWAPPQWEDSAAFVSKALVFRDCDIYTPQIYAVDYHNGFLLIEDFGDQLYAQDCTQSCYAAALQTLQKIQALTPQPQIFPQYNEGLLSRELGLFPTWFLGELLHLELRPDERELIQQVEQVLIGNALEQPQVVVHRDYHCRNLMVLPDDRVGVIDFQDAVIGPVTYDLVSILKDCYQMQQQDWVEQQALMYAGQLREKGQLQGVSDQQFLHWFDLMGLQRHIKVLGIFARLSLRDGKHGYLKDLPLVIRYTLEVSERYSELAAFGQWFRQRVLPALPQHPWYKDWQSAGE